MKTSEELNVPGTVHLVDLDHNMRAAHLKGSTAKQDIVLVPAPSADPEDPLNWSWWRKLRTVMGAYIYISAVGFAAASVGSVVVPLAADKGLSITQVNLGTGLTFLFLGWSCLIWQPIALVFGRRGVYLLSTLLSIIPIIWSVYLTTTSQWLANRIILGIVASPSESLPEVTIPDMYFAHNRGFYMGLYASILFGSNFVAPLCAGFIFDAGGWQWVMWFGVISLAVSFVYCFFFMEETMYFRSGVEGHPDENEARPTVTSGQDIENDDPVPSTKEGVPFAKTTTGMTEASGQTFPAPRSYMQKLGFFRLHENRPTNSQLFKMMYRPLLIILFFPCTAWAGLLYGTSLSWYNIMNATMSLVLTAKPYNFSASMVGVAYVSPLIGSAVAFVWSGFYADRMTLWFARRNDGIREPEHRLWTLLVSGFAAPAGLILWGVGAAHHVHWVGLLFGIGMMTFSLVCGSTIALSYNVDCFKELTGETMISIIIIRNTLGFGFSYAITPWIDNQGLTKTFVAVGMISLATMLTFLIMVWCGKRLRKFSAPRYYRYITTTVGVAH